MRSLLLHARRMVKLLERRKNLRIMLPYSHDEWRLLKMLERYLIKAFHRAVLHAMHLYKKLGVRVWSAPHLKVWH